MSERVCASSAPNGSSISRNSGLDRIGAGKGEALAHAARTAASARHRRSPPAPSAACSARTCRAISASGFRFARSRSPKAMLCLTVSHGKTPYSWKITPRSGPGPATGLPSSSTFPLDGVTKPATHVHHRGFAAPRRADDRNELAFANLVGDILHHTHRPGRRGELKRYGIEPDANGCRRCHANPLLPGDEPCARAPQGEIHEQCDQANADDPDVDDVEQEERRRVLDQCAEPLLRGDQLGGDQRCPRHA